MIAPDIFKVYAVKYLTRQAVRHEHFYGHDSSGDDPMPMDYFVWAAVSPRHTVVIDTGTTAEVAARRQRQFLRCPVETLHSLGIDCAAVNQVILTHLHYDHTGNVACFPSATYIVQDDEVAFWTGRYANKAGFRNSLEVEDLLYLVRANFAGRLRFVDGSSEVVPGITVHRVKGHSPGLQVVRINTARGYIVLATDASHYYANIEEDRPFIVVADLRQMYAAFETVRSLADSPDHIIPGHDPLVLERYPAVRGFEGIAVQVG